MMLNDPHSRIVISSDCEKSLAFEAQGLTLSPHVPRTSTLSSSVFHAASALFAPTGHLPHAEKALSVVILFPHMRVFALTLWGKAVFSYRSLPHWGSGTVSAVDRVLSLIVDLRCISSLSFIPLEPYPARFARYLPHAGKVGDTRETCHPQTFGHRPIYICGEAATTTLNPAS